MPLLIDDFSLTLEDAPVFFYRYGQEVYSGGSLEALSSFQSFQDGFGRI